MKDKYSTNNIDLKVFFYSLNQNGYNHVYNKNQSALLFSSLFELRNFRSFHETLTKILHTRDSGYVKTSKARKDRGGGTWLHPKHLRLLYFFLKSAQGKRWSEMTKQQPPP
uniref:Uncharacterized protein n=1 Tax=Enterobacter sp. E22 TaxID=358686 RepID=A8Y5X3_9ENTR|nr:hypothetical protein [Enterobacter sp. E22]